MEKIENLTSHWHWIYAFQRLNGSYVGGNITQRRNGKYFRIYTLSYNLWMFAHWSTLYIWFLLQRDSYKANCLFCSSTSPEINIKAKLYMWQITAYCFIISVLKQMSPQNRSASWHRHKKQQTLKQAESLSFSFPFCTKTFQPCEEKRGENAACCSPEVHGLKAFWLKAALQKMKGHLGAPTVIIMCRYL